MAPLPQPARVVCLLVALALLAAACTAATDADESVDDPELIELDDPPRRYSATWLIDTNALAVDESVASSFLYREVVDDQTGTYLVESPDHLALQYPEEVVFCAAVSRIPLDPFCASAPRAEGSPNVLSYPIQTIRRDWGPSALYDLASYREVSLVAASDPANWSTQETTAAAGFPIVCFLAIGETSAAATGFEICYTDDDLRLIASVDLQNDLIFEIDLVSYERVDILGDFETGFEEFTNERPALQEQLLALYPEIPAARPASTPESIDENSG